MAVQRIIQEVRINGDQAVHSFYKQFDGVPLEDPLVTEEEMTKAFGTLGPSHDSGDPNGYPHIRTYHERQLTSSWFYHHQQDGSMLGQKGDTAWMQLVYVPGGTGRYPSSVLMNVIPALVAGVQRIVLVTPPGNDGYLSDAVLLRRRSSVFGDV
ncbi:histidinol dehydrogenase [Bacillus sp. SL00103]